MIYPITFQNSFNNQKTYQTTQDKRSKNSMEGLKRPRPVIVKHKQHSPLHEGLSTAASWFGFGIVLDRLTSYASKYIKASPIWTSIITNGIVAAGAGLYTYYKSKKS